MKKTALLLALLLLLSALCTAYAVQTGDERVVLGGDLTAEQVTAVYQLFDMKRGDVPELSVSIGEEREYLEGLVKEETIGQRSISCAYIQLLPEGSGLDIRTENITWCSRDMYRGALITAGITDARVIVAAPWAVSGTAGLVGIFKAYEDISGEALSREAKAAGIRELTVTAGLADDIGGLDAVTIVGKLKELVGAEEIPGAEGLKKELSQLAEEYDVELSGEQTQKLLELCDSLKEAGLEQLREKLQSAAAGIRDADGAKIAGGFVLTVKAIFRRVADFFAELIKSIF